MSKMLALACEDCDGKSQIFFLWLQIFVMEQSNKHLIHNYNDKFTEKYFTTRTQ